jgi:DNA-binding MarR family transcriptional regulator
MWKQTYSKVFDDISKEIIWKVWRDVNNWQKWHTDIQQCSINTPFLAGGHFTLKPKLGPATKATITAAEKNESFTYCISFLGGKMFTTHEMAETSNGLKLTTTITVTGPLRFLWRKLHAKKIANAMPEQTQSLVNICKIETESIRVKVNAANKITQPPILVPADTFSFENPKNNPGLLLWQSTINWQQNLKKILEPHNISHTQFAIMFIALWSQKNKRPLTQANICTQTKLDKVTVSKSLKSLEEQTYVSRLKNELDTRTKLIELTPQGKKLAEDITNVTRILDSKFFENVQENEAMFIGMMKTLRNKDDCNIQAK